jgi:hypothetical protein
VIMSISAGTYTIGPGYDYTSIRAFASDIAANLTGDLTGVVKASHTEYNTAYFHTRIVHQYTLLIDNAITRTNHQQGNTITFDSTFIPFQGIYLRQDADATSLGRIIVRNQHFKRINGTFPLRGQDADIYCTQNTYPFRAEIYNNVFEDRTGSWYPLWTHGDATGGYTNIYNNIFYGEHRIGLVLQNFGRHDCTVTNNLICGFGTYSQYGTAYGKSMTRFVNNYFCNHTVNELSVTDSTCICNVGENVNGGTPLVGPNYRIPDTVALITSDWSSSRFGIPNPQGGLCFKGITPGHTQYFNGLPIIPGEVTIGALSEPKQVVFNT